MRRQPERGATYAEASGEAPGSEQRETVSGGGGDVMDGRWGFCGRRKGPSVTAALSFRCRAALQETSASRIRATYLEA